MELAIEAARGKAHRLRVRGCDGEGGGVASQPLGWLATLSALGSFRISMD